MNTGEFVLKALEKTMIVLIVLSLLVMCVLIIAIAINPLNEYVIIEETRTPTGAILEAPTETITINPIQLAPPGYTCRDDCDCMKETIPSSLPAGEQNTYDLEYPILTV